MLFRPAGSVKLPEIAQYALRIVVHAAEQHNSVSQRIVSHHKLYSRGRPVRGEARPDLSIPCPGIRKELSLFVLAAEQYCSIPFRIVREPRPTAGTGAGFTDELPLFAVPFPGIAKCRKRAKASIQNRYATCGVVRRSSARTEGRTRHEGGLPVATVILPRIGVENLLVQSTKKHQAVSLRVVSKTGIHTCEGR